MNTAIILAGGLGTRISSVLGATPKCMAPVGNTNFINLLINKIYASGFNNIIVSLGFNHDKVLRSNVFRTSSTSYFIEEIPLGTGGAIYAILSKFGIKKAVVFNGDSIEIGGSYSHLLQPLNTSVDYLVGINSVYVDDAFRFGIVESEFGFVTKFIEKGIVGPGWISSGAFFVDQSVFDLYKPNSVSFSFEKDILAFASKDSKVYQFKSVSKFFDIGVPDDYSLFLSFYPDLTDNSLL